MSGEAEQSGIVSLKQPVTPETEGHVCGVCHGPDYRACGCEAKIAANGHVCPVCHGPDHRDCGCEAKATDAKINQTIKDIEQQGGIATPGTVAVKIATDAMVETIKSLAKEKDVADMLLENREAQLAVARDIVEQLKAISESLKILIPKKKPFPESLN